MSFVLKMNMSTTFFDCAIAKAIWHDVSLFSIDIDSSYESVARYWVANNFFASMNTICAAVLWSLWTFHNDMIFNHRVWLDLKQICV